MKPAFYLLLGYPGTGKYTIAREIVHQLTGVGAETKLLDNHAVGDLIFPLVPEADGKSPLPAQLIDRYRDMNSVVLKTIEQLSPHQWSFVFTHHLVDDHANRAYVKRLEVLSASRDAAFVPVTLTCEPKELLRRVVQPERHGRKLFDPERAREYLEQPMLRPDSDNAMTLDVTSLVPANAAAAIIASAAIT